jgi:hypothetical protein
MNMQTKNILKTSLVTIGILVMSFSFFSCEKDDAGSDKTELFSYGPSPALRGGELKFIGSNLDKVTAIVLPNNIEITSFVTKTPKLIIIQVPEETIDGKVYLKTAQAELMAKSTLVISEPIEFISFSPASARPGDVITINGKYLNLISEITFHDRKLVTDFDSRTKEMIKVKLPLDAQSGVITISNGASEPILIDSETELQVVLPAFSSIAPNPVKAGTMLTINGTNLDLVEKLIFASNITVETFTNQTATKIEVMVPADAKDGNLKMTPASGVEVASAIDLIMEVPTITGLSPNPVKPGSTVTLTGTNLDLATVVNFGGNKTGTIASSTATTLVANVPTDAITGVVTLITGANKEVVSSTSLVMVKPEISDITPLSLQSNEPITITGTNLDLVTSVTFTGGIKVTNLTTTATSIMVIIPPGALSGTVLLEAVNGDQVTSIESIEVLPSNIPLVTSMPASAKPGSIITITGEKLDLLTDVIFPGNVKATMFGVKTATRLDVYVPINTAKGTGKITFVTIDNETTESPEISIQGVDPVVNANLVFYDFDAGDASIGWGDHGEVEQNPDLSISGKYYRINKSVPDAWGVYFMRNWGKFSTSGVDISTYAVRMDINILDAVNSGLVLKFRMTSSTQGDFWYVWKIGEEYPNGTDGWITVTFPLNKFFDNDGNGTGIITDVTKLGAEYGLAHGWGSGSLNMCVDNVRFEPKP